MFETLQQRAMKDRAERGALTNTLIHQHSRCAVRPTSTAEPQEEAERSGEKVAGHSGEALCAAQVHWTHQDVSTHLLSVFEHQDLPHYDTVICPVQNIFLIVVRNQADV